MKKLFISLAVIFIFQKTIAQTPHISLQLFSSGYTYPLEVENCGDSRLFIVQQGGYIYTCDSAGVKSSTPFLDIHTKVNTLSEQGLLGLAFDPDYANNRTFYIYYTKKGGSWNLTIARYKTDSLDPNKADTASAQILLSIPHPTYNNHNGGCLRFGPDGYLYAGTGDGGSGGDPPNNSQNHKKYLGKLLRIDVHNDSLYAIPPDNPFVNDTSFYPEIYAYGLRNPWRYSFDHLTGDLWIGDVGQNIWEEVDYIAAPDTGGQDFGWHCYEGNHTYTPGDCNGSNYLTFPIAEYKHQFSDCSITGGFVYRGGQYSKMFGKYFFCDYCSGKFRMITHNNNGTFTMDSIADGLIMPDGSSFASFGVDRNNELYVADVTHGKIYHVVDTACAPVAFIIERLNDSAYCDVNPSLHAVSGQNLAYQWYQDSTAITGATSSEYDVTQPGVYTVQVINSSGCMSTSQAVTVGSHIPVSMVMPDTVYCVYQTSISLTANPSGGNFLGDGVSNNEFNPNAAGVGYHTLYYTYDNFGCVSVDSQVVYVDVCTGMNADWEQSGLNIFPNPSDGSLSILLRDTNDAVEEISLWNVAGQLLFSKTADELPAHSTSIHLQLSNLSNGVYAMKIMQGGKLSIHKVIINH